jgi:hypothetical protein
MYVSFYIPMYVSFYIPMYVSFYIPMYVFILPRRNADSNRDGALEFHEFKAALRKWGLMSAPSAQIEVLHAAHIRSSGGGLDIHRLPCRSATALKTIDLAIAGQRVTGWIS